MNRPNHWKPDETKSVTGNRHPFRKKLGRCGTFQAEKRPPKTVQKTIWTRRMEIGPEASPWVGYPLGSW
jgi:hypothetical protein